MLNNNYIILILYIANKSVCCFYTTQFHPDGRKKLMFWYVQHL